MEVAGAAGAVKGRRRGRPRQGRVVGNGRGNGPGLGQRSLEDGYGQEGISTGWSRQFETTLRRLCFDVPLPARLAVVPGQQLLIWQNWHSSWSTWRNCKIEVNKTWSQTISATLYYVSVALRTSFSFSAIQLLNRP